MPKTITTERCILTPIGKDDTEELHALWILPEVREFLWDGEAIAFATTAELVAESVEHLELGEYGLFGARPRGARKHGETALFGFCGYWPFHEPVRTELLFGLAPSHWGRGLATEIAEAMILFGSEELGFDTILASTDAPNSRSIAVLERLGMQQTELVEKTDTCLFELPLPSAARR